MPCRYYDCGWCYAPLDKTTTDVNGQCNLMEACPQSVMIPAINLNNSLSADNFYPDKPYNLGDDEEEHY